MSMYLEFEPHSWYMGFAIKRPTNGFPDWRWHAYTEDGMTYSIVQREANTSRELKDKIRIYHLAQRTAYGERLLKRSK